MRSVVPVSNSFPLPLRLRLDWVVMKAAVSTFCNSPNSSFFRKRLDLSRIPFRINHSAKTLPKLPPLRLHLSSTCGQECRFIPYDVDELHELRSCLWLVFDKIYESPSTIIVYKWNEIQGSIWRSPLHRPTEVVVTFIFFINFSSKLIKRK